MPGYRNFEAFKADSNPETQELNLCHKLFDSEIDLKRNLDRELNLLASAYPTYYRVGKYAKNGLSDAEFARGAFVACRESLKPFFLADVEGLKGNSMEKLSGFKNSSNLCATYLTKFRAPNAD
jgi:hypothetical protein